MDSAWPYMRELHFKRALMEPIIGSILPSDCSCYKCSSFPCQSWPSPQPTHLTFHLSPLYSDEKVDKVVFTVLKHFPYFLIHHHHHQARLHVKMKPMDKYFLTHAHTEHIHTSQCVHQQSLTGNLMFLTGKGRLHNTQLMSSGSFHILYT